MTLDTITRITPVMGASWPMFCARWPVILCVKSACRDRCPRRYASRSQICSNLHRFFSGRSSYAEVVGRWAAMKRRSSSAISWSSGAPQKPPCGIASQTCRSASTPAAAHGAVHAHGARQREVARPGLQERRRERWAEVSEERREVGIGEIMVAPVEPDEVIGGATQRGIESEVGVERIARLCQVGSR